MECADSMALILVAAAAAAAATAGGAGIRGFLRKRKEGQGEGEEGSRVAEGMSRQSSLDEIDLSEVRGAAEAESESVSSCLSAFPPLEEDREEQHSHYSTATVALSEGGRGGGEGGAATDHSNSSDTIQMHTVD